MGTCLSWTSSAIPMLQRPSSKNPISNEEGSWIGSLITLGACLGAIPAGYLAGCFGRKRLLQMLAAPIFLSWMIIAFRLVKTLSNKPNTKTKTYCVSYLTYIFNAIVSSESNRILFRKPYTMGRIRIDVSKIAVYIFCFLND